MLSVFLPLIYTAHVKGLEVSKLLTHTHLTTCPLDPILNHPAPVNSSHHHPSNHLHDQIFPLHRRLSIHIQIGSDDTFAQETLPQTNSSIKLSSSLSSPVPVKEHWQSSFEADHWITLKKPLFDPNQSGFNSDSSEIRKMAEASAQSAVLILLGLSTVSDTVNQRSILSGIGITGNALSWFKPYLSGNLFRI